MGVVGARSVSWGDVSCPSATLAVWCSAWLYGTAGADDVLDALHAWGDEHGFVAADDDTATLLDMPASTAPALGPAEFLGLLRRNSATGARLALPVPGDVRGLGAHGALTKAALRAGEAAVFSTDTAGTVGVVAEHLAEGLVRWSVFHVDTAVPAEHTGLGEAEHLLSDAVRDSAVTLGELDIARERPGVRDELSTRLRSRCHASWPRRTPQRALRVLQRADEVHAIVELALTDEPGGAHSASAATKRAEALRPLSNAVRTARCAAVDESVRVLTQQAARES